MMMAREHPRTDQPERWQSLGACKTRPDLNWFPERGENIGEQRQVCAPDVAVRAAPDVVQP